VVTEIRIYVEGGGNSNDTKSFLRRGFNSFLKDLIECARRKRIGWKIIVCGGREQTYDNFKTALRSHPTSFNVLLVDAEAPVGAAPWQHLHARDNWMQPPGTRDEQCHLMAQTMETWLVADRRALEQFYGPQFRASALPVTANIESIDRSALARGLDLATRGTQKGTYHKIKHGAALLEAINPVVVRAAAPSCERLFTTLAAEMGGCP
jgi:hypothetical protein